MQMFNPRSISLTCILKSIDAIKNLKILCGDIDVAK